MKKKSIRIILLILICAILMLGVFGCANNTPSSSPSIIPSQPSSIYYATILSSTVSSTYAKEIVVFAAAGTKPAIDEAAKSLSKNMEPK